MKAEKMREWSADELENKEREFSDQLFRLKFQMASGQADLLQKIRVLRKDIAANLGASVIAQLSVPRRGLARLWRCNRPPPQPGAARLRQHAHGGEHLRTGPPGGGREARHADRHAP